MSAAPPRAVARARTRSSLQPISPDSKFAQLLRSNRPRRQLAKTPPCAALPRRAPIYGIISFPKRWMYTTQHLPPPCVDHLHPLALTNFRRRSLRATPASRSQNYSKLWLRCGGSKRRLPLVSVARKAAQTEVPSRASEVA